MSTQPVGVIMGVICAIVFAYYLAIRLIWLYTKAAPVWFKVLCRTGILTTLFSPCVVAGHGGIALVPGAILCVPVLISNGERGAFQAAAILFAITWAAVYTLCMACLGALALWKKI